MLRYHSYFWIKIYLLCNNNFKVTELSWCWCSHSSSSCRHFRGVTCACACGLFLTWQPLSCRSHKSACVGMSDAVGETSAPSKATFAACGDKAPLKITSKWGNERNVSVGRQSLKVVCTELSVYKGLVGLEGLLWWASSFRYFIMRVLWTVPALSLTGTVLLHNLFKKKTKRAAEEFDPDCSHWKQSVTV